MSKIQFRDSRGSLLSFDMQSGTDVNITDVSINETITVNASAVTPTGQQPVIESVQFIGPSRAGQPISKKC